MSNFTLLQNNHEIFAHKSISSFKLYRKIRCFFFFTCRWCVARRNELAGGREPVIFRWLPSDSEKKTAKLCNSVNAMCHKTHEIYKHLGKGGDPGHVLWLWMMQFFSASRNSLSFRWWLAAEVSGREKTNTALHSTSPKPARIQKNLVSVGLCVQLWLGRWQADFARPRQLHVFLCLWLNLSFFCQTQRWSACSSQWRKSWRDSTARARKATTRWGRRDFTLSVWFAVFEHESRSILISAKHSQTQKQVRRKQSLSKVASDLFCFFSYFAAAEHYWS